MPTASARSRVTMAKPLPAAGRRWVGVRDDGTVDGGQHGDDDPADVATGGEKPLRSAASAGSVCPIRRRREPL